MITKEMSNMDKCCLYASDFHLEMILVPYIKNNMDTSRFVILSQNSLENTIKVLLSKLNLSEETVNNIYNINWDNQTNDKMILLKKFAGRNDRIKVIINGDYDFVGEKVKAIRKMGLDFIEIVKCYKIEDVEKYQLHFKNCEILNTKSLNK